MNYAVIMAGGSGTRFWPKSTSKHPKQFLNLLGERSLLQMTIDRLADWIPPDNRMVVTNGRYESLVRQQVPDLPGYGIVAEPFARNTAPCVAAAAELLYQRDPDAVMIVLPADHQILDHNRYLSVLKSAVRVANEQGSLVTIGLKPDRPETGYGYIQYDRENGQLIEGQTVHPVKAFTEKPDLDRAKRFIGSGDFLWNSGMFIWRADSILEAFKQYQPDIYQLLDYLRVEKPGSEEIDLFYKSSPSVSIDYAIMEKADEVHVIPTDVGWSDLGSWKVAHELAEKDSDQNAIEARYRSIQDSTGNLVQLHSKDKLIALVGVENLAVVETEDAILICDLNKSQDVRKVIEDLKAKDELGRFL